MDIPEKFHDLFDKYGIIEMPEDIKDDVGSIIETYNEDIADTEECCRENLEDILECYKSEQEELEAEATAAEATKLAAEKEEEATKLAAEGKTEEELEAEAAIKLADEESEKLRLTTEVQKSTTTDVYSRTKNLIEMGVLEDIRVSVSNEDEEGTPLSEFKDISEEQFKNV